MAAVIAAIFLIPKLPADIIPYLFPDPEKISWHLILKLFQGLIYLGGKHFGNESCFFEGQGLLLLEWLFILSPCIVSFMVWSIKIILGRVKM